MCEGKQSKWFQLQYMLGLSCNSWAENFINPWLNDPNSYWEKPNQEKFPCIVTKGNRSL